LGHLVANNVGVSGTGIATKSSAESGTLTKPRQSGIEAGWFVSGLVIVVIALTPLGAEGAQQPDFNCNTRVNEEAQETSPTTFKGNQSTLTVATWNGDCIRVSSIAITKNTDPGDVVEIGWSLGYYINNNGICCSYTTVPLLFEQWTPPLQPPREYNVQPLTGSSATIKVQDGSQNMVWTAYLAGTAVGISMAVDFARGNPISNGERHSTCKPSNYTLQNPCDSAWSHFWSMKRWKVTDAGYTSWQSQVHGPYNNDPWYYYSRTSATESYVRLCSTINCGGD
jgi:hypothetical protein